MLFPLDVLLLDMEADDMYGEEVWLAMLEACNQNEHSNDYLHHFIGRDALEQLPAAGAPHAILVKPFHGVVLYQTLQTLTGYNAEKEHYIYD